MGTLRRSLASALLRTAGEASCTGRAALGLHEGASSSAWRCHGPAAATGWHQQLGGSQAGPGGWQGTALQLVRGILGAAGSRPSNPQIHTHDKYKETNPQPSHE